MILTRKEFISRWNDLVPNDPVNRSDHPLLIPETEIKTGPPSRWFVLQRENRPMFDDDYWKWCNTNLAGQIRCYMFEELQDGDWAWWGFTNKKDITIWLLRWA